MKRYIDFFHEIGKLNNVKRKGLVLIGAKNPNSISEHIYRATMMTWMLGNKRKINLEKAIKMSLIHDICELYAGDITPYDKKLPKDKKKWPDLFDKWPRSVKSDKIKDFLKKHKKEKEALVKITANLPEDSKKEILALWYEYEKNSTKEAKFVKQVNRLDTLFEAFECGKKSGCRPFNSWWVGSEEHIDDPLLIECMLEIADKFYHNGKKTKKRKPVSRKK